MTTTFAALIDRCGLSQREAAMVLDVSADSVRSWSTGRRIAPPGVIDDLRRLYGKIERAAERGLAEIAEMVGAHGDPELVELGYAADDHEARQLGFPCVGAHVAMLGLVAARAPVPVVLIPRGSTIATAGAVDARER